MSAAPVNSTLCYIVQDGKYLMLHRVKKKHDQNKDKWIGIGGKFEAFESPEDCILRETKEETGLTLTDWRYRGIVTFVCDTWEAAEYMHLFTADGFTGTLIDLTKGICSGFPGKSCTRCPCGRGIESFSTCWRRTNRFSR